MNLKETLQFIFDSFRFWFTVNPWEAAVRVRFGKYQKLLTEGVYLKIPYFDRVYIQEKRLRIRTMPIQSISTRDGVTFTIKCAIGYQINDLLKMYNTVYQPETTITNIAMDEITKYLMSVRAENLDRFELIEKVITALKKTDFGITFEYCKIASFCQVRTYRLIQDQHWDVESLDMSGFDE